MAPHSEPTSLFLQALQGVLTQVADPIQVLRTFVRQTEMGMSWKRPSDS